MNPKPAIVVTLPARTIAEARAQIDTASRSGADLVEIRCDRFSASELAHLGELFPAGVPLIATLRSRAEGGEGPDDPNDRARTFEVIAHLPFREVDVEVARDIPLAGKLARPGGRGLIASSHSAVPVSAVVWGRWVRESGPSGAVRKVVVPATVGQLLSELLPLLPPPGESALVAHTVGPSGPLLRAWGRRFGFPLVYASLPEEVGSPPVELSQIPVDRLRPFVDAEGNPPLFAVVGRPVGHSRSPSLHARWMRSEGKVGLYVALDFGDEREFIDAIPPLIEGGFRGLNVTHPLKGAALEVADRVSSGAVACGVANTLSFEQGEVDAENTDLVAILRRLEELRSSGAWKGDSLAVIGAGGAARATLAAARSLGVEAHVWARRPDRASALAEEFGSHMVGARDSLRPSLIVHATPLGREPVSPQEFPKVDWLRPGSHLLDWVYAATSPVARVAAEKAGATYEDGSRLLVYQAAASYGLWWGEEPAEDEVAAALEGVP
jgi:shikimate dehydrogenase/3-dehydroquinate dehydratase type I